MVKKLRLTTPVGVIAEAVEVAADSVEAAVVVVSVEVVVDTIAMAVPDTVEAAVAVSGVAYRFADKASFPDDRMEARADLGQLGPENGQVWPGQAGEKLVRSQSGTPGVAGIAIDSLSF